ncbi:hypothetical protein LFZ31_24600 [Salmonella enterica subsp. enterica serovar Newport str. S09097]|nr:hypothetical protein LFZ31_24600 [Salmonella enterica subsp. enterica serovar Newport str. S09097]
MPPPTLLNVLPCCQSIFFSAPELFAPRFPALWQRFCQFYRQDPSQRLRVSAAEGDYGEESEH